MNWTPPDYSDIISVVNRANLRLNIVVQARERIADSMDRLIFAVLCWSVLYYISISVSCASVNGPNAVLVASRARSAPRIDGKLDDPAWDSARRIELIWTEMGTRIPEHFRTQVSVVFDDKGLYIAFINHDPAMPNLRSSISEHDRCLTGDDTVGIFLEPGGTGDGHSFRVTVNAGNTVRDVWRPSEANLEKRRQGNIPSELIPIAMAYVDARDWEPMGVKTAVRREDDLWTVEISIPFEDLLESKPTKETWGVNFMRRIVAQHSYFVTWTNGGRRFIRPDQYGRLLFSD